MMQRFRNLLKELRFSGNRYACIVCGRSVRTFFRFSESIERQAKQNGFVYDFRRVETLNYDLCNCPFCLSSDRERLYMIYLKSWIESHPGVNKILDFAPNAHFSNQLRKRRNIQYISTDILRDDVDVKTDVSRMDVFGDEEFDIVIFSHVLEHVEDTAKSLSEIFRVLKKKGFAIIMVPLFLDVTETVENSRHTSEAERWRYYGQGDHVRLFSRKDFLLRVSRAGFHVREVRFDDLDKKLADQNAIDRNSVLYICEKL